VRIRALELLGKITDVGLFTERSEVTITHRSKEELVVSLREKIQRLRASQDVIDVDIDKTLGLTEEVTDVQPD
jgi:predicted transposase YdaD